MRSAKIDNLRRGLGRFRLIDWLAAVGMLVALALMAREADRRWATPDQLAGFGEAIDGDSLIISGKEVRLKGIDAPEMGQSCQNRIGRDYPCGLEAKRWLRTRLLRGAVTCRIEGTDRHGRLLGLCRQGEALLNADMVREGLAVSFGDYGREEAAARAAQAGLWQGRFVSPSQWRETQPQRN